MSTRPTRKTYWSWRRLVGAPLLGAVTASVWLNAGPLASKVGLIVTLASFLALGFWPAVRVTPEAIIVRNLRRYRLPWPDVTKIEIGDQTRVLGRFWNTVNRWFGRGRGYTGIVVHARDGRVVPAFALQSVSPFWNLGRDDPPWLCRLQQSLEQARSEYRRGD